MWEIGVYVWVGIGFNKVLVKIVCDNFVKKNKNGIFILMKENMKIEMWLFLVGSMFGVGSCMKYYLNWMGISMIGGFVVFLFDFLKKKWGINGYVLWMMVNGIDYFFVLILFLDG